MDVRQVIASQYNASLEMLRQTIEACPDSLWADPEPENAFWHIAYHALFYTHLYLQPSEEDFTPWERHRAEHQFMGTLPWSPHREPKIGEPYSREELLNYLELCLAQVEQQVAALDLEAESGFEWLPFGKLELQFYNIRHLQLHTGELMERLGAAGIHVDWVGARPS